MTLKDRPKSIKLAAWLALPAVISSNVAAASTSPSVSVSAETVFTNNANKSSGSMAFDERQDSVETSIAWDRRFDAHSNISLDYDILYETFSEDSSDNEFSFNGSSSYNFSLNKNITGQLEHSIKQLLKDSSASEIRDNLDDRNIYSAEITATYTPAARHYLSLTPSIEEIKYKDSDSQDSTRIAVEGSWKYLIDSTSDIAVNISRTDIDYKARDTDQEKDKLSVSYNKSHRQFTYFADLGVNRSSSNTQSTDEPYAKLSISYDQSAYSLNFTANRTLTDTSYGNGNQEDLNSRIDGNLQAIEQLVKEGFTVSFNYKELCPRCSLKVDYELNNEEYINAPSGDFDESIISSSLSYQLDRTTNVDLQYSFREVDYNSPYADYDIQETKISFSQKIDRVWNWTVFTEYESKDADLGNSSYSEFLVGLKVGYQFK